MIDPVKMVAPRRKRTGNDNMKATMRVLSFLGIALIFSPVAFAQQDRRAENAAKAMFLQRDADQDGKLTRKEFPQQNIRLFDQIDTNKDGAISLQEDIDFRLARTPRQRRQPQGLPEGVAVHRDLIYAQVGQRDLPLDLYLPKSDKPLPVVVWIHGGGWRAGSKGNAGPARPLVGQGYAVIDVEYRLSGEAIFPAQIQDCKAAIRWLRANAKTYNLDGDHIGVWGSSAGGHLVALLGTSGDVAEFETAANAEFSSRVQAVCDWFGPTDLLLMNKQAIPGSRLDHDAPDSPESKLVGGPIQTAPFTAVAKQANPINYVSDDDPPFLIVHGDNDRLVSHRQSEMLHAALTKAGVASKLQIEPGAGHGFSGGKTPKQELVQQAAGFFDQHLK
jgi:acetyl esterase/lipase